MGQGPVTRTRLLEFRIIGSWIKPMLKVSICWENNMTKKTFETNLTLSWWNKAFMWNRHRYILITEWHASIGDAPPTRGSYIIPTLGFIRISPVSSGPNAAHKGSLVKNRSAAMNFRLTLTSLIYRGFEAVTDFYTAMFFIPIQTNAAITRLWGEIAHSINKPWAQFHRAA